MTFLCEYCLLVLSGSPACLLQEYCTDIQKGAPRGSSPGLDWWLYHTYIVVRTCGRHLNRTVATSGPLLNLFACSHCQVWFLCTCLTTKLTRDPYWATLHGRAVSDRSNFTKYMNAWVCHSSLVYLPRNCCSFHQDYVQHHFSNKLPMVMYKASSFISYKCNQAHDHLGHGLHMLGYITCLCSVQQLNTSE